MQRAPPHTVTKGNIPRRRPASTEISCRRNLFRSNKLQIPHHSAVLLASDVLLEDANSTRSTKPPPANLLRM
jgi:hypothetical protein